MGNGICQIGVIVSENDIMTGESCHLRHALLIKYELPAKLSMKTTSHQNLNITGKDKYLNESDFSSLFCRKSSCNLNMRVVYALRIQDSQMSGKMFTVVTV